MPTALIPLVLVAPLLVWMAYGDLRFLRIPNLLCIAMVAVFAVAVLVAPPPDLVARLVVAGAIFGLGFVTFCLGLFGGGDVKALSALMLFVPAATLPLFCMVFSASMMIGIAFVLGLRAIPATGALDWASMERSRKFPMGVSIAMAGMAHPFAVIWLVPELPI
ncbi:prepilin peptidase [Defluviimonas sp. D31]|uniref:prepilin peptidase n=1 Tax=Defluviimonas sp. D31 TaxID=3083253 RepID=UPI00296EB338|nr:prepilin peptidase [Defluviimonas sp. D31]MDW4550600.1 prepilin peptidase [Defluviimonas sp. D31]